MMAAVNEIDRSAIPERESVAGGRTRRGIAHPKEQRQRPVESHWSRESGLHLIGSSFNDANDADRFIARQLEEWKNAFETEGEREQDTEPLDLVLAAFVEPR